ncbi:YaaC family protein [Tepidicaulis sp. LMO-SS28]|uniref:YaaC family protein n=1 Tax=Tepidicaulis sp. LMO-SS28 TaxID=3447455 RepID=UPI003EE3407C
MSNPRLDILRREVEQTVIKPFLSHGWKAAIKCEVDRGSYLEVEVERETVKVCFAVLYSSSEISNAEYKAIESRVSHIFFQGQPYKLESFTRDVEIPVESLDDFFPFLVSLNKQLEPDKSPSALPHRTKSVRRLVAENPIEAVTARLQQFTSVHLAEKLVKRRFENEHLSVESDTIKSKAKGVAYSLRSALNYFSHTPGEALNKRVLELYYGSIAFAQAEMLAAPHGPADLDEVEGMTKFGHGLYTLPGSENGFADFNVGVLATGFLPRWLSFLGQDVSEYPKQKPKSIGDLYKLPRKTFCELRHLFASMPEVDDLFAEVFGDTPRWISVDYDNESNSPTLFRSDQNKNAGSTYGLFIDQYGLVSAQDLEIARWPISEIRYVEDYTNKGVAYRARVDHAGHDFWWGVLPIYSSPFGKDSVLLLPTVGGMREYRTIAVTTLYALSIMVRYMPSAWWRVEGGNEDQYLALVKAATSTWSRVLPEQFLESIAGETVHTTQPGSFFA